MPFFTRISYSANEKHIHTKAQSPDTLLKYLSTGLGALSTRISIILTKSFHITHTRAQSTDIGSGACQYNIQGQMPFFTIISYSDNEKLFTIYIQGFRALTLC